MSELVTAASLKEFFKTLLDEVIAPAAGGGRGDDRVLPGEPALRVRRRGQAVQPRSRRAAQGPRAAGGALPPGAAAGARGADPHAAAAGGRVALQGGLLLRRAARAARWARTTTSRWAGRRTGRWRSWRPRRGFAAGLPGAVRRSSGRWWRCWRRSPRAGWCSDGPAGALKVYETWVRTGNDRLERVLVDAGMVPPKGTAQLSREALHDRPGAGAPGGHLRHPLRGAGGDLRGGRGGRRAAGRAPGAPRRSCWCCEEEDELELALYLAPGCWTGWSRYERGPAGRAAGRASWTATASWPRASPTSSTWRTRRAHGRHGVPAGAGGPGGGGQVRRLPAAPLGRGRAGWARGAAARGCSSGCRYRPRAVRGGALAVRGGQPAVAELLHAADGARGGAAAGPAAVASCATPTGWARRPSCATSRRRPDGHGPPGFG